MASRSARGFHLAHLVETADDDADSVVTGRFKDLWATRPALALTMSRRHGLSAIQVASCKLDADKWKGKGHYDLQ